PVSIFFYLPPQLTSPHRSTKNLFFCGRDANRARSPREDRTAKIGSIRASKLAALRRRGADPAATPGTEPRSGDWTSEARTRSSASRGCSVTCVTVRALRLLYRAVPVAR